jgi:hypothetical protein
MRLKLIGLVALYAALSIFAICLQAGEPPAPPKVPGQAASTDVGKRDIERGPEAVAAAAAAAAKAAGGRGKGAIELGPKEVLATTTPAPAPPAKDGFVNPKVAPGKVNWHADFDAACKAAAKTGKPVLLFQMMGKLDDQFC